MLRALLLQLSSQLQDDHADLTRLHDSYKTGVSPSSILIDYLQRLIQRFHHVYILLNALDESPRNGPREDVLRALEATANGMPHWTHGDSGNKQVTYMNQSAHNIVKKSDE